MAQIYAFEGLVPVVHPTAFLHPTAVLIGDVIVGPDCYVGPGASLRGDMGRLVMQRGSNVQDNCTLHCFPQLDTVIEEDGHIGHGAVLHGCRIARNALVGMNSVVMDGAVVGESAFVAAMAFVKAGFEVPPRSLVGGIPAKVLRTLSDEEIAWKSEGTREYQDLAVRCRQSLTPAVPLSEPEPDRARVKSGGLAPLQQTRKAGAS
ncbi:phenylacetic acid degradation protein PaaY [Algihabitans albus]|uniref:phenylacetic acid degradation protein PaaY n=1 Tax=Algihabitans albus TaxID=2164067 RepID=UPI0035CFF83B